MMGMENAVDQSEAVLPYRFMPPTAVPVEDTGARRLYRDVQYALITGFRPLVLDLTVPHGGSGPVPVVVYIHPGAWLTGSPKPTATYRCTAAIQASLLGAGVAVASVQYRLSSEALFPACLHDVASAVRWLRHFAHDLGIDPDRIGSWGESAGGHLSTFLALNLTVDSLTGSIGVTGADSTIQAAVSWYPATDFLSMHDQALPGAKADHDAPDSPESRLIGAGLRSAPDRARRASPITWVNAAAAPLLCVHGENDLTIPPQQSETLCHALRVAGTEAQLTLVPGADHQLVGVDPTPYIALSTTFLLHQLGR